MDQLRDMLPDEQLDPKQGTQGAGLIEELWGVHVLRCE